MGKLPANIVKGMLVWMIIGLRYLIMVLRDHVSSFRTKGNHIFLSLLASLDIPALSNKLPGSQDLVLIN